eukprot:CAMPEP_0198255620 /NCGR_PEP_ID=MMETSP1447-20131203/5700_1 /TAXON_ID=420782 /ORGANISM="Chaetoceros dichaeta, Strain CCMP1751" /LENGTH=537 /DNA_ID=CAMNT_0043942027 /DNA_START=68 /DNA_END=1681 /DNA_ORIENTATION=-
MGGAKTYVPYPTFNQSSPRPSSTGFLSAVGRCRIHPKSCCLNDTDCTTGNEEFDAIVKKAIEQSQVGKSKTNDKNNDTNEDDSSKKLKKKYMKEGIAMAQTYLSNTLTLDTSIVDVEIVLEPSAIIQSDGCIVSCFLDAGCAKIVVAAATDGSSSSTTKEEDPDDEQCQELVLQALDVSRVPKERLIVEMAPTNGASGTTDDVKLAFSSFVARAATYASTISVTISKNDSLSTLETASNDWINFSSVILQITASTFTSDTTTATTDSTTTDDTTNTNNENLTKLVQIIAQLSNKHTTTIPHGILLTLTDPTAQTLGHAYTSSIRTDRPDNLYTTVVTTRSNEALGLVYSSHQSIIAALQSGRGVYYSRSRNGLWRKGDTSGNFQTLHRIDVDCDGDALRFMVTQRGDVPAFCHLEELTCWGPPHGVRHLEQTLTARLVAAPEGSYTKRLFEDGELLRDKLVEEAQELAEAEEPRHVAEELADVLYFAMVKAAKAGVSLDDAIVELDKRRRKVTRRKGDSKAFRIAAGDAILKKNQEL